MKYFLFITLMFILGCNSQTLTVDATNPGTTNQSIVSSKTDRARYYVSKDTIIVVPEINDTLRYSKEEFNRIIDRHPEFISDRMQHPDLAYSCANKERFSSEVGQDGYYVLYAQFFKHNHGVHKYAGLRKKLIELYSSINSLFQHFEYGGTYFGHQYWRIIGYTEYSVYLFKLQEDSFSKTYDISTQKELYIKSLRQLVEDEVKIDSNTFGEEKIKRKKELNKIIDKIDEVITDKFYLGQAQEFQYSHYQSY